MSQSGSGTGSSLDKDDRPILGAFQDRKSEFGSWRTGFSNYVSRMRELCPEESHPDEEWLNKGFAMISLDQGQEVATQDLQGAVGSGGQVPEGTAQAPPGSLPTMQKHLDAAATGVAGLRIRSKHAASSQRVKDRHFRVQHFANKAAQVHAADLFDIQMSTQDLAKIVKGVAPYLALNVCQTPPANSSEAATSVVTSPLSVGDIISPLLTKIGRLHCLVDNHVHLQQSASMSTVGYNAFYTHKNSLNQGLKNYGGHARASEGFLAQDRKDTEAAVRNSKARQKLLSSEQKRQAKSSGVDTAKTVGGDGNSKSRVSRSRHNKKQRELYQKHKKAKRAKLAAQAVDAVPGDPPSPSEPMEQEESYGDAEV